MHLSFAVKSSSYLLLFLELLQIGGFLETQIANFYMPEYLKLQRRGLHCMQDNSLPHWSILTNGRGAWV